MGRRGATAIAGLALAVAGCSGGGDDPSDTDTGSTSPSSSPSSSASSPSETPKPASTVEPATGVELEVQGFRVNAPDRWRVIETFPYVETATGPVGDGRSGGVLLGAVPVPQMSLAQAMRRSWLPGRKPAGFEEQPSTVLGGLTAFYYTAEGNKYLTEHVMGNWDAGLVTELSVTVPNVFSPERQKEIVDSIVATYHSPRPGAP